MKILKFFEIFGNSFSPTVSNSSQITTGVGGIFWILYCSLYIYASYNFSVDLINIDNPNIINKVEINNAIKMSLDMPFGVRISSIANFRFPKEERLRMEKKVIDYT